MGLAKVHNPYFHVFSLLVRGTPVGQVHQGQLVSLQAARIVAPFPEGRLQVEVEDNLKHLVKPGMRKEVMKKCTNVNNYEFANQT